MSGEAPLIPAAIAERFSGGIDDLGFAHGVHAFAAPSG
ncbi:MAG: NADH-quinone oxidoreductase subunit C, partial [Mesorhizobium sp.]